MAAAEESASLWLEAHDDPLAGLCTFPSCMALVDLHGDGDHKLVVGVPRGPGGPRLAVVRGAGTTVTLTLPEAPSGLGAFGPAPLGSGGGGGGAGGPAPPLVVAAGPALYVYRNLRPFYKYSLPPRAPHPLERDLWLQAAQDEIDPAMLKEMLEDLRDKAAVTLTAQSLRLLALPPPELPTFVELHKGRPLQGQTVVTCLGALPRGGPGTPDCPVLGTEAGDVLVLDPEAFTCLCQGWVPSPPAFVVPRGPGDGRCRLALACRDGGVYGLHRARTRARLLAALGSPPLALLAQGARLLAATRGAVLALSAQGRRLWVLPLPEGVAALAGGALPGRGLGATLVALETLELRLYRGRSLLCVLRTQDVVTGLCFGRYGREDNTLIMTTRGGALSIRMLRRRAELGGTHGCPPPAPSPRLPLPPRTRLFVDRALREREDAPRLHGRFQRELGGLRLGAARGLARALGGGATPAGGGPPIALTASVQGLDPRLRVTLRVLLPGGAPPAPPLLLLLRCRPSPHRLQPPHIKVPLLVPGLSYVLGTWLELGGGAAPPGRLQVLVLCPGWEAPLLTVHVALPRPAPPPPSAPPPLTAPPPPTALTPA